MLVVDPGAASGWRRFRREFADACPDRRREMLRRRANQSRVTNLAMIGRAGLGHVGGDLSVLDILTTLFFAVLRVDPEKPEWADRDRFVLSKGHAAGALYATLAATGFFAADELRTFAGPLSALNGHPNRTVVPGVETNTGPLGHGLPVAVGMAVAARLCSSDRHVYVVLGDGELQEGSNWEAAMTAGHRRLTNLTAIVDRNRLQQGAPTEETNALDPLDDKFRSFGWDVTEVDGHDPLALLDAFMTPRGERPTCVIANTVKGAGVTFMQDRVEWHHQVPTAEQIRLAQAELTR
jgi:transketolase